MNKRIKRSCILFILLYITFGYIHFDKNIAIASQTISNQAQTSNVHSNNSTSNNIKPNMNEIVKYIVTIVFAGTVSLINIYKFVIEKRYEIESANINLISEIDIDDGAYTKFRYDKVLSDKKEFEISKSKNPYQLDVSIKLSLPNTRKKVNNIAIRKLIIDMNGYQMKYKSEGLSCLGSKKCIVDKQNDICLLLLTFPIIKENKSGKLNPIFVFQNPEGVRLRLRWCTNVNCFSIFAFWLYKTVKIEFEKADYQKNLARIGIKSKRIY